MTPEAFIALWKNNPLTERAGAQGWFDELCELLGVAKPRAPDNCCCERGAPACYIAAAALSRCAATGPILRRREGDFR